MTSDYQDHKQLLASLPASERKALTTQSNTRGLLQLAGHSGLLIITCLLYTSDAADE